MALSFMHDKKIVHRDLKPQNIFLCGKDKQVKIGDFGLSKSMSTKSFMTTMGGTPLYMAPELLNASKYTAKVDIWALGCIGYELCMLKHPFIDESYGKICQNITSGKYPPISTKYAKYNDKLIRLITKMLVVDEKKRIAAGEIVTEISDLQ